MRLLPGGTDYGQAVIPVLGDTAPSEVAWNIQNSLRAEGLPTSSAFPWRKENCAQPFAAEPWHGSCAKWSCIERRSGKSDPRDPPVNPPRYSHAGLAKDPFPKSRCLVHSRRPVGVLPALQDRGPPATRSHWDTKTEHTGRPELIRWFAWNQRFPIVLPTAVCLSGSGDAGCENRYARPL